MAKTIRRMDTATIAGLRGKLDVYDWMGIQVVRKWPAKAVRTYVSPAERNTQLKLGAVAPMTGAVSAEVRAAYHATMQRNYSRGVTWVDNFRSVAMGGASWYV